MQDWPVTLSRKIRFSDTDAQGIVFNGNYFRYWDDTLTDYLDAIGLDWSDFNRRGFDMVLAHADIDFRWAARLGDVLVNGARVSGFGTSSVTFELRSWLDGTETTVVEGKEIQVIVDHDTMRPVPIPDFFVAAIHALQDGQPTQD